MDPGHESDPGRLGATRWRCQFLELPDVLRLVPS
jgi:hypothetical protein